jgi:hypothetical protein
MQPELVIMIAEALEVFDLDYDLLPASGVWRRPSRRQGQALWVALRRAQGQP